MSETLQVSKRKSRGTKNARRQRAAGSVPAVLYGHGEESVSLSVDGTEISAALRQGARLVELQGDVSDKALIREVQWDTFGIDILHVDFTRVSADERIEVTVVVELRGVAPGTKAGGVVDHQTHEVQVECPADSIPEKLQVNINSLELGESISVSTLELPEGSNLLADPDTVIVQCIEPAPEADEEGEAASAEPELIGRKASDEDEGGGS